MQQIYLKSIYCLSFTGMMLFSSCRTVNQHDKAKYQLTKIEGRMLAIDSTFDHSPDPITQQVLTPYKEKIDQKMYEVIGTSAMTMDKGAPESLLSNLVAEALRLSVEEFIGRPADMGLVNMGGLRNILPKGEITVGVVYEILPFENSLCILTLKGTDMKRLFQAIATRHGEGVSGVRMTISKDGKLLDATINGQQMDDNKLYTVATIDYLADGNSDMTPLLQAVKRECPDEAILRDLFLKYVRKQTAEGKVISSAIDGRMTVK